jgi:hypothetical protein
MTMEPRLNLFDSPVAARFTKYLISAGKALSDSAMPAATQELVEIGPARSTAAPSASRCTPRTPRMPGKASSG